MFREMEGFECHLVKFQFDFIVYGSFKAFDQKSDKRNILRKRVIAFHYVNNL